MARPPAALLALLRLPSWLYRIGLGGLLGHRFLLLVHRGRRSGRLHMTVLEVMRFDPQSGESDVMAGFGPGSDWLRNLEAGGGVKVETGGQSYVPEFRVLDAREGAAVLADYERRNRLLQPLIRVVLSRLAGWRYDQTSAARLRLAAELPLLALYPTSNERA